MKAFVIFGIGRSGSILLASLLLNEHPAIHCDGEIFRRAHGHIWPRPLASRLLRCPFANMTLHRVIAGPSRSSELIISYIELVRLARQNGYDV